MESLYITAILLLRIVQALCNKNTSNEIRSIPMLLRYGVLKNILSAALGLILILYTRNTLHFQAMTVLFAAFAGLSLLLGSFFSIYAMKSGTVSLNSMFATAGMILPIFAGALLFHKPISPLQIVGLGLFFISAYLLIVSSRETYATFSAKTFLLLIGTLLANGCTMLAQQMFTQYVPDGDVSLFSCLTFSMSALLSWGIYLLRYRKKPTEDAGFSRSLILCGCALAVAAFVINQFVTVLTKSVAPVVLFTIVNGGDTIISTIVAAVVYRERLGKRSVVGIILGVFSLVLIKLFA